MAPWLLLGACVTGASPDRAPAVAVSRMTAESSPYLRQHAQDLVDWWPWGPAAFAEARKRDVPVLLVIGYASCHWCHVLAEESFRDPAMAASIDARFVPVLVDREERPDVDAAQLRAAQTLTGKGLGWPLVVLLSPDGEVLFATSYLPAHDGDRGVKVGLETVLLDLSGRWSTDRDTLVDRGRTLARDLAAGSGSMPVPPSAWPPGLWRDVDARLGTLADREHGGFGGAPKFPRPVTLDTWLAWSVRHGRPDGRDFVAFTLQALADSALHDPLDGGFHRYAVDDAWREPHFEKMLTDNAQLGRSYLDAKRLGSPGAEATAKDIARYLTSTWIGTGLAAALDADSMGPDGVATEGAYYVLTRAEVREALGDTAGDAAADALGLAPVAATAPRRVGPLDESARQKLVALRSTRAAPARDDKVVLGWQGLALGFFARAGRELPDGLAAKQALRLGTILDHAMLDHASPPPRTVGGDAPALLDDYAYLAEGMVELFLATNDERWLRDAEQAVRWADQAFARPDGGHWRSALTDPPLPVRPTSDDDGTEPPAAPTLARVRLRLAALRGDESARDRVRDDLLATSPAILERPASHTLWLRVADELGAPPPEVVITWPAGTDPSALRDTLFSTFVPGALELVLPAERAAALAPTVPLLAGKDTVDRPTAFVCTLGVCQAPATTPAALRQALAAASLFGPR